MVYLISKNEIIYQKILNIILIQFMIELKKNIRKQMLLIITGIYIKLYMMKMDLFEEM